MDTFWIVPGLFLGCFILEGLRQSSLECFFDQTCLDDLQSLLISDSPIKAIYLNTSQLFRSQSTTLIGVLIDELMVENWHQTAVY